MSAFAVLLQVSLFSENSSRWLVADQAIMLCGAADAVRGASSPPAELAYIMRQSDSSGKHKTQPGFPAQSHVSPIQQRLVA